MDTLLEDERDEEIVLSRSNALVWSGSEVGDISPTKADRNKSNVTPNNK